MKFSFLTFFIGLRYVSTKKHSQMVSFLSGISIVGLVVGVALLLTVLSVMNGFDKELREKIIGLVPQAVIYRDNGISDWQVLSQKIMQNSQIQAVAPFAKLNGLLVYKKNADPILLYGINTEAEKKVSLIEHYIKTDTFEKINAAQPWIIIGKNIADKHNIKINSKVMIVVPNNLSAQKTSNHKSANIQYFTVADILSTGTEIDNAIVITSIDQISTLTKKNHNNTVQGIRLKMEDLFQATRVLDNITQELGYEYYGESWINTHGNLYQAIQMSKNLVSLLMLLIIGIAAFNVVSTLIMVVIDKEGDIAILRTLGASTSQIMSIFMIQGGLIGILGCIIGIACGLVLSMFIGDIVLILEQLFNFKFLKADVYLLTYVPCDIRLQDCIRISVMVLFLSLMATLYPAYRASKIQPADALRYE